MKVCRHARMARGAITATLVLLCIGIVTPAQAHRLTIGRSATTPIYIGQIASMTGTFAVPGTYWLAGPRLAIRQINAHGGIHGRPLKMILADDHSTTTGALSAFRWLTRTRHLAAIIGPLSSPEIQALTPSIERARIPVIIGGGPAILTHEGDPWVFRTQPDGVIGARVLATFAVGTLHLTRIAILHDTGVSGSGLKASLLADLGALGVVPLTDQSYPIGTSDLTAQVLAIKKSGATALITGTSDDRLCVLLARQMDQIGLHVTLLGTAALATAGTRREAGPLVYGAYAVTPYAPGQSPEAAAFDQYSRATLHLPGDFASAYSYDGMQILARVMRKVGTNPHAIRRGILAIRGYRGVMGTYNFDPNGDGLHQSTVVQNVHGRLRVIKVLSF